MAENRLRDYFAGNRWDPLRVGAIDLQPVVQGRLQDAVDDRGAGGKSGQDRQEETDGRVQPPEFLIVSEGEVEMGRLQVRPAMAPAVEDPVVGLVDLVVMVRPQFRFPERVHPGMGAGWEEAGVVVGQNLVDPADIGLKERQDGGQRIHRQAGLEFDDVQGQFVGPADPRFQILGRIVAGDGMEDLVADRLNVEGPAIYDHVFQFNADAGKEVQWCLVAHDLFASGSARRSILVRNDCMMIR